MYKDMKGKRKRILGGLLCGLLLAGQFVLPQAPGLQVAKAASFTMGTANHWAEPYMRDLFDEGVMRGDISGNMNPDRKITRAEFVSIINRAFGYSTSGKNPFKDVKGTEWYAKDLSIAYHQGYFSGSAKSQAEPMSNLTREQAVALLCRNLNLEEYDGETFNFQDSRSFQSWSRGSINAATEKKVVAGYKDGTFRPANPITRGEAAKIISTALGERVAVSGVTSLGYVNGNATICASGATLRDTVISGDLYITPGVGLGFTDLVNVKVMGDVIVSGAGESNAGKSSIKMTDCTIHQLVVNGSTGKGIALKIDGSTEVYNTKVKSDAYLEELTDRDGGFSNIQLDGPEKTQLHLLGTFDKVTVLGKKNELFLDEGEVNELVVDEEGKGSTVTLNEDTYASRVLVDVGTTIYGEGEIGYLKVNADDVVVEGLPDEIEIRSGTTATINGRKMTSQDAQEASSSPKILSKYPDVEEIGPTSATSLFKTNKSGTLYWAISLEDNGAASIDELLKPSKVTTILSSGNIKVNDAKEEFKASLSSLKANTEYIVSAVLVDERGDESSRKTTTFTSADNTVPGFISGYPKVVTSSNTSAEIAVNTTKDATVKWVVLPSGSVTPTIEEMRKEKYSGKLASGSLTKCKKNVISTFTVSGLSEEKTYDAYVMATDGTNYSAVQKLAFTTMDKTPPVFNSGYPKMDKVTDTSVAVKYNINEDGTVYYIVLKRGTVFPAPVEGQTTVPGLDSDIAKQAVVTGNNAIKSGKATAKANNEGSLTISGLLAETSYDLYMVAQDKSSNNSVVSKLYIKTADNIAPTAKLEFEEVIDKNPTVESEIRIVFSEEVKDAITNTAIATTTLVNNLTLYDMSAAKRTAIPLDYEKMTVKVEDGITTIIIPQEATKLKSGNKYEFELNHIIDTSNNKMPAKTVLPQFQTVAPLVEMSKTVSPENLDMTFELSPHATNTADEVLFDMLLISDSTIRYELYEKNQTSGKYELITGEYDATSATKGKDGKYVPFVLKGEGLSLHYILDRKMQGGKDFLFEPYNQLKNREYGIRIVEVEGNSERESWSKTVKLNIKCIIGSKTNLSICAGDPVNGLSSAVKEGAIEVGYPKPFEMMVTFTDTVIPQFLSGYPSIHNPNLSGAEPNKVGDTSLLPLIRTNKKGTMYYLVAPKGTVKDPTGLEIMMGTLRPQNSVRGQYIVESADVEYEITISGLKPEVEYEAFFCLKGTPPEPSDVTMLSFKTKDISSPVMNPVIVTSKTGTSASVSVTVDKTAQIHWIVYPSVKNGGTDLKEIEQTNSALAIKYIRDGYEDPDPSSTFRPICYGNTSITVPVGSAKATSVIQCTGLSRDIYYDFYAVAKSPLGGKDSVITVLRNLTPADITPPTVTVASVIKENPLVSGEYYGSFGLTFSEPLYYMVGENTDLKPLTAPVFTSQLYKLSDIVLTQGNSSGATDGALRLITYSFTKGQIGETLTFPYNIYDTNRNLAGSLVLKLENNFVDNVWTPKWTATFVKVPTQGK